MKIKDFASTYMGKVVRCHQVLRRSQFYDHNSAVMRKRWHYVNHGDTGPVGWVIGIRTVHDGYAAYMPEEGPYWRTAGNSHRVAMIALRPELKPLLAPLTALELCDLDPLKINRSASWKGWQHEGGESSRKWMSDEMKKWPRDDKGRWVAAFFCGECRSHYDKTKEHVCPSPHEEIP